MGMFLICPVFLVTSNICFLKNDTRKNKIIKNIKLLFISPCNIYIYSIMTYATLVGMFKLKYNSIFEYIFMIIFSFIFMFSYQSILQTDKKRLSSLIYNSFILIQITTLSTISVNLNFKTLLLVAIILPSVIYILYFQLIGKPISKQEKDISRSQIFLVNILPILAELVICSLSFFEGKFYLYQIELQKDTSIIVYACATINYLFLIFDFVVYNIVFININKTHEVVCLNNELSETQEQIILAFAKATESKSGDTGEHVKRVSEYCKLLALKCGYNSMEAEIIRQASMLHDIGKIGIPDEILNKPGKLTNEEFDVIKTHVNQGAEMISDFNNDIMKLAKIIALQHHEKWDGTGYLGYKGTNIDKAARIAAIADVFDAICSKRCYKNSLSCEQAKEIILEGKGKHFDPELVEIFEKNYDEFVKIHKQIQ
jgi:putative nucleotidyltransferase with HDIG domain